MFFYGFYQARASGETCRIARALRRFKYAGDRGAGRALAAAFRRHAAASLGGFDAAVPIPLHPHRLRARGFNQAAWLARPIAHTLGIPLEADGLRRRESEGRQAARRATERRRRVVDAFEPGSRPVHGRSVLLVDDVMTTGATLAAAASALRAAGAGSITVAVLLVVDRDAGPSWTSASRTATGT